jgi:bifunctional protein TilS/HprT
MVAESPVREAGATASPAPRFAHQSEAEFARLLDFYGVRWEYEPRSFPLRYRDGQLVEAFTPDFYLPDYDTYIELTTLRQSLITYKNRKLRLMRELYPDVTVKLINKRDYLKLLEKFGINTRGSGTVPRVDRILFTEQEIAARVEELGRQISRDYAGRDLVLVGVLRGVTPFMADLMRRISVPLRVDYLALSPYQGDESQLRFTKALEEDVTGAHVLVVEDIVDTGMSLHRLLQYLRRRNPAAVDVCALLDKRARRLVDVPIAYVGFEIGDEFVVGYGLDYRQQYRNLPFIATIAPAVEETDAGEPAADPQVATLEG